MRQSLLRFSGWARLLSGPGQATAILLFSAGLAAGAVEPTSPSGTSERRVALVIGNGAYDDLGNLPNPPNDATDMTKVLEELQFEVISVIDGDSRALKEALKKFHRSATGADMALFYFAGHGIALDGENYLVPIGAEIEFEADLPLEAVSLNDVQRQLEYTNAPLKMVILDACRNNPLARTLRQDATGRSLRSEDGLARMEVAPASGLLIAFASAPGSVALDGNEQRNSPFTAALLNNIREPQVDARVMFGRVRSEVVEKTRAYQTPFVDDSMLGEFEFNPVAPPPEPVAPPSDLVEWKRIYTSDDPATFDAFLQAHPDSDFASMARDKLATLRDPEGESRAWAVAKERNDLEGYEIFLRRYPSGDFSESASLRLQKRLWGEGSSSGDIAALRRLLERFPDGEYAELAQLKIDGLEASGASAAGDKVAMLALTDQAQPVAGTPTAVTTRTAVPVQPEPAAIPDAVPLEDMPHLVQYALSALGFYTGTADGKFGPASQAAVKRYQRSIGAEATGRLTSAETVSLVAAAAKSGDANSQVAYGVLFAQGSGVPKDEALAAEWFGKAAEAGNGIAQYNLGIYYRDGIGVPVDRVKARSLLGEAAVNGIAVALDAIAAMPD